MRPAWLIEAGVYGPSRPAGRIRRQGMAAEVVPHQASRRGPETRVGGRPLADGDCVVGYGTFPSPARSNCTAAGPPVPGATRGNTRRSTYSPLRQVLLEPELRDHARTWSDPDSGILLYEVFAGTPRCSPGGRCNKVFTGRCVYREDFASAWGRHVTTRPHWSSCGPAVRSGREWRLVVAGDRVIAAVQYAAEGDKCVEPVSGRVRPSPRRCWRGTLAARPIFMLDVCDRMELG